MSLIFLFFQWLVDFNQMEVIQKLTLNQSQSMISKSLLWTSLVVPSRISLLLVTSSFLWNFSFLSQIWQTLSILSSFLNLGKFGESVNLLIIGDAREGSWSHLWIWEGRLTLTSFLGHTFLLNSELWSFYRSFLSFCFNWIFKQKFHYSQN